MLTGAFGLRCSEALSLKREDICLSASTPKIVISGHTPGASKSPGDVYVRKHHLGLMRNYLRSGITALRTRGHKHGKGTRKTITYKDHWDIPGAGYIFCSRTKASKGHLHYQAVYAAVKREAPKFARFLAQQGKPVSPEVARLRPHSGRATLITELMGEGMVTALSMKYARHAPDSYKVHLKYGRLTLDDVKAACDALRGSRKTTQWSTMTTQGLLHAQKAIARELQLRLQKK
jgi:integrase